MTVPWLGLQLLQQERSLQAQRGVERQQAALGEVIRSLEASLTEAERYIGSGAVPHGMTRLTLAADGVVAEPADRILWLPARRPLPGVESRRFADAERLEFHVQEVALASYQEAARSSVGAVRAGALLRAARVLRRQRQWDQALAAYERLATLQGGLHFSPAPRWSPDGRTFIAAARNRRGKDGIFRIDAQSGEVTIVVYGPKFSASPLWSRDGGKIYYMHNGLIERDLTTGTNRALLPSLTSGGQLAISPDGRFLALAGVDYDRGANRRLQIVPTGDGQPRDLLQLADGETWGPARTLVWAPDSRAVLT